MDGRLRRTVFSRRGGCGEGRRYDGRPRRRRRRCQFGAVIRPVNLPQSGRQGRLRSAAQAVVAPFDRLVGGSDPRALCGFGGGRHLHVTRHHLVRRAVVRNPRVAASMILPHVRARGRGEHLPPRAQQERDENGAHGHVTTPHKPKLQVCSETVLAAQYSTGSLIPAIGGRNLDTYLRRAEVFRDTDRE